jgi:hypothetical protein
MKQACKVERGVTRRGFEKKRGRNQAGIGTFVLVDSFFSCRNEAQKPQGSCLGSAETRRAVVQYTMQRNESTQEDEATFVRKERTASG